MSFINTGVLTSLNAQILLTNVTMDGTDKTIFTYTVPAATLAAGQGLIIRIGFIPSGATSTVYKIAVGGTTITLGTITSALNHFFEIAFMNDPGSTTSNSALVYRGQIVSGTGYIPLFSLTANDTGSAMVLTFTGNAASGTVTPTMWGVEFIK